MPVRGTCARSYLFVILLRFSLGLLLGMLCQVTLNEEVQQGTSLEILHFKRKLQPIYRRQSDTVAGGL